MIGFLEKTGINPRIAGELKNICEKSGNFSKVDEETKIIPYGNRDGMWSQMV